MANIIKRITKGSPLTNAEVDSNFENLNVEKLERDGSVPMTDNLVTPGVQSSSTQDGLRLFNQAGELVAILGPNNTQNLIIEGNIEVGEQSQGANLNLSGGDITARNLFISGKIISSELGVQYGVSGDGDIFRGSGETINNKLVITTDVILKLVTIEGEFNVGNEISGSESGTSATITRIEGNSIYVELESEEDSFVVGETISYFNNTGVLSVIVDASSYETGQNLKLFGASIPGTSSPAATPAASANKVGSGTGTTYYYWVTQFRYSDGKVSPVRKISGNVVHRLASEFNAENHISLRLSRSSVEYGMLVYRSTADDLSSSKLIDVLGPDALGNATANIIYIDFGGYANTEWSTKDSGGAYTENSGIIHFPLSGSNVTLEGWVFATVDETQGSNKIILDTGYDLNADSSVSFVHDNTEGIQKFIDDQRELNLLGAEFPNGTYYTSKIKVPSNFEISGSGKQTVIKQIPWNFDYWDDAGNTNEKGNIFVPLEVSPTNMFFRNLSVDGNFICNARYDVAASTFLINIPNGENINFISMRIANSTGGGIYTLNTKYLRVQDCEVVNGGGVSYLGENLSPLYAGSAEYMTITNNLFENFLNPVDVSVSSIGTVVGNTVRNCGSGLLVYGSAHLVSSPNLLMGPDNEFLPSPDTMDSDYNAVNITLDPGVDYISPSYLYIERGVVSYLGSDNRNDQQANPIPGTAVELSSTINMLTQLNNAEELKEDYTNTQGGSPFINFISPDTGDYGRNEGYFQFKIVASDISEIPTLSKLITDHGDELLPGEEILGLAYRILAKTYTYTDVGERIEIASSEFSTQNDDKYVTITLQDSVDYTTFVVNDIVKVFSHSSTPDINNTEGTVVEKIEDGLTRKIKILLPAETDLTGAVGGGQTGYVTIRKTFIIAKGRIN
jgi:hypothetical protein